MKRIAIITSLFSTLALGAAAQGCDEIRAAAQGVAISGVKITPAGGSVTVGMTLNLDGLDMPSNSRLVYTPVVKCGDDSVQLRSIVINGRKQQIMYERGIDNGKYGDNPIVVRRKNGTAQTVSYLDMAPANIRRTGYESYIHEDLCGCGNLLGGNNYPGPKARKPLLRYPSPEAEQPTLHLAKEANIIFRVDKTDLDPDYKSNRAEFDSIVKTIDAVRGYNATISRITIHGYASPESPYEHNAWLAENRAKAIKDYVCKLARLDDGLFAVEWTPEAWDELRERVVEGNISNKEAILAIIDDTGLEPDPREWKLKSAYPQEYKYMLEMYYPDLRHTKYDIAYVVKPRTVEEARRQYESDPSQLTLHELYLVARSYDGDTGKYNEVMKTALELFPNDEYANLQEACLLLDAEMPDRAVTHLNRAGDSPEALNAWGVYYWLRGDEAAASAYFEKSGLDLNR